MCVLCSVVCQCRMDKMSLNWRRPFCKSLATVWSRSFRQHHKLVRYVQGMRQGQICRKFSMWAAHHRTVACIPPLLFPLPLPLQPVGQCSNPPPIPRTACPAPLPPPVVMCIIIECHSFGTILYCSNLFTTYQCSMRTHVSRIVFMFVTYTHHMGVYPCVRVTRVLV